MPDPRDVLNSLEALLRRERELFGESLLAGDPRRSQALDPVAASAPPAPADLSVSAAPAPPVRRTRSAGRRAQEDDMLFTPPAAGPGSEPWTGAPDLAELEKAICTCMKCPLGATRTKFVFGVGNPAATLMLVGEAPGADEDLQGEPFVGRAGQLLTKILEAIRFRREDVYICNILKCRPPNNRTPAAGEVEHCLPYLRRQIQLVRPRVILCLGLTAAQNLLGTTESLSRLRGNILSFEGIPLMVTYHPAALLRNPNWKRPAWEDVQAVRALHDRLVAENT